MEYPHIFNYKHLLAAIYVWRTLIYSRIHTHTHTLTHAHINHLTTDTHVLVKTYEVNVPTGTSINDLCIHLSIKFAFARPKFHRVAGQLAMHLRTKSYAHAHATFKFRFNRFVLIGKYIYVCTYIYICIWMLVISRPKTYLLNILS